MFTSIEKRMLIYVLDFFDGEGGLKPPYPPLESATVSCSTATGTVVGTCTCYTVLYDHGHTGISYYEKSPHQTAINV